MTSTIRNRRNLTILGTSAGALTLGAFLLNPYLNQRTPHEISTPGTQNIENRFSIGGGAKTHVPAAGTKRGDSEDVAPNGKSGLDRGGKEWEEKIGGQVPGGVQRGHRG